jgi:hypothetical protein
VSAWCIKIHVFVKSVDMLWISKIFRRLISFHIEAF